jgi:hypothetical protein
MLTGRGGTPGHRPAAPPPYGPAVAPPRHRCPSERRARGAWQQAACIRVSRGSRRHLRWGVGSHLAGRSGMVAAAIVALQASRSRGCRAMPRLRTFRVRMRTRAPPLGRRADAPPPFGSRPEGFATSRLACNARTEPVRHERHRRGGCRPDGCDLDQVRIRTGSSSHTKSNGLLPDVDRASAVAGAAWPADSGKRGLACWMRGRSARSAPGRPPTSRCA